MTDPRVYGLVEERPHRCLCACRLAWSGSFYGVGAMPAATARDPSSHSGFLRSRTDRVD